MIAVMVPGTRRVDEEPFDLMERVGSGLDLRSDRKCERKDVKTEEESRQVKLREYLMAAVLLVMTIWIESHEDVGEKSASRRVPSCVVNGPTERVIRTR